MLRSYSENLGSYFVREFEAEINLWSFIWWVYVANGECVVSIALKS